MVIGPTYSQVGFGFIVRRFVPVSVCDKKQKAAANHIYSKPVRHQG